MTNVEHGHPSLHAAAGVWIESTRVQKFIIALILFNAVTLGLETSSVLMARYGTLLASIDKIVLGIFVLEILTKLFAFGWRFFKNPWNVFDFIIVGIALVPASGPLTVLRTLRVLRVLRLVSMMPQLRFVVEALLHALPGIGSIAMLMVVLYYVFAVMATGLFGGQFPEWFGTIGHSMYTLFQVMTLESWSMGIARPVMETYPYAWLFFVPFILVATFTILNLFIAIIVNTMQTLHEKTASKNVDHVDAVVHTESANIEHEIQALRREILELKTLLSAKTPG
jgi:voltage-gated sodium channel